MIFYRLTDNQAARALNSVMIAVPFICFLALQLADRGHDATAAAFGAIMVVLLSLIGFQIVQSRRLNAAEREITNG